MFVSGGYLSWPFVLIVVFVKVERHISFERTTPKFVFVDLQEELDGLAANYPDRFKVYYVLNQVSSITSFFFWKLVL